METKMGSLWPVDSGFSLPPLPHHTFPLSQCGLTTGCGVHLLWCGSFQGLQGILSPPWSTCSFSSNLGRGVHSAVSLFVSSCSACAEHLPPQSRSPCSPSLTITSYNQYRFFKELFLIRYLLSVINCWQAFRLPWPLNSTFLICDICKL